MKLVIFMIRNGMKLVIFVSVFSYVFLQFSKWHSLLIATCFPAHHLYMNHGVYMNLGHISIYFWPRCQSYDIIVLIFLRCNLWYCHDLVWLMPLSVVIRQKIIVIVIVIVIFTPKLQWCSCWSLVGIDKKITPHFTGHVINHPCCH